jgi:hypothetical protein
MIKLITLLVMFVTLVIAAVFSDDGTLPGLGAFFYWCLDSGSY